MKRANTYATIAATVIWALSVVAVTILWFEGHRKLSSSYEPLVGIFFPFVIASTPGPIVAVTVFRNHVWASLILGLCLDYLLYWLFFRGIISVILFCHRKVQRLTS
jgi:hypothetical protein